MHYVRLIELVDLKKSNEKTFLHIRLFSEHEIELYWEIDNVTAINIYHIFESNGNHRYRVSLNSTFDKSREQFVSSLTKTYRDISKRITFDCSDKYNNDLESIKNIQSIAGLNRLPFIFRNLPVHNETTTIPTKSLQNELGIKKHSTATFNWLVGIVSVVLLLFTIFSYLFVNKTSIDSNVVIAAQPKVNIIPVNSTYEKNNIIEPETTETTTLENDSTLSSHPYISTDNSVTYSIPEGYVALTFDDGPSKDTMTIADILKEYNVGGTFFFLGSNAKKFPDSVRYVLENGYSIGSHSMSHSDMTKLTIKEQEEELLQSAKILEDITEEKINLFRPPYGALNEQVTDLIQTHGYKIVQWNKDPKDWKTKDSDKIVNYVRENKASGSIIILHESQAVIDALPEIIEILQEQNLKIINLQ